MSISASQALKDYSVDLLKHLPLEDVTFFEMVKKADLFPLTTGDSVKAKPIRAEKVSYFLGVIGPGADIYLPKLLKVMKESDVADVVTLAEKIAAATGIGGESILMVITSQRQFHTCSRFFLSCKVASSC